MGYGAADPLQNPTHHRVSLGSADSIANVCTEGGLGHQYRTGSWITFLLFDDTEGVSSDFRVPIDTAGRHRQSRRPSGLYSILDYPAQISALTLYESQIICRGNQDNIRVCHKEPDLDRRHTPPAEETNMYNNGHQCESLP